jgi:hypothetical protein
LSSADALRTGLRNDTGGADVGTPDALSAAAWVPGSLETPSGVDVHVRRVDDEPGHSDKLRAAVEGDLGDPSRSAIGAVWWFGSEDSLVYERIFGATDEKVRRLSRHAMERAY